MQPMPPPAGKREIEALKVLLDSAQEMVTDLVSGPTQRVVRALAAIPPDEREMIALALERATTAWQMNEAFHPLNHVRLRANPHAQLFVRVFDPVEPPPDSSFDILPETLRLMRRLGIMNHPEAVAIWEPVVRSALEHLTPEERASCVGFLERALAVVSGAADHAVTETAEDEAAASTTARRAKMRRVPD